MKIIKDETGASQLSIGREGMGQLVSILEIARVQTEEDIKGFEGQETLLLKIWVERLAFIQEVMDTMMSIPTVYRGE